MKDKIIYESIKSLRQEGLKFSVDTLAENLKISKKTVYKYFPDKGTLALALYEKYYDDAETKAEEIISSDAPSRCSDLLYLYFDSKVMTRDEIFNKYNINESIKAFTQKQGDRLWATVSKAFSADDLDSLRYIIDGTFEMLTNAGIAPDSVIERLVKIL